jgi:TrmH family RNA methyltransferase
MTITSTHNEKLIQIRKLQQRRRWRERAGRFVAEGEDLLAAADAAGWPALERYCVARSGLAGVEVEPEVLASVSDLGSGTRALGVYEERWAPRPHGPLCVYLHGVSDPGNIGAVLRSAQAFGASSVALGPGSADPFGPKAVRASMGAVFAVPLARATSLADLPGTRIALVAGAGTPLAELWRLRFGGSTPNAKVETSEAGVGVAGVPVGELGRVGSEGWTPNAKVEASEAGATVAGVPAAELWRSGSGGENQNAKVGEDGGGVAVSRDADAAGVGAAGFGAGEAGVGAGGASAGDFGASRGGVTLLIGAERGGLPEELIAGADHVAQIPIHSHSLNAAMAATVALYEVTRMAPE